MGKLLNGPQGQVSGLVGNNISYMLNGQNVIRIRSKKKTRLKNLSVKQRANCQKLAVINSLFGQILPLLKAGFANEAHGTKLNYHNVATSYNKLHALKGEYPSIVLDYPQVRISFGNLPMPLSTTVEITDEGVEIKWTYTEDEQSVSSSDQTIILLHFPELEESICIVYGLDRGNKAQLISLPEAYRTAHLETYFSFISADRSRTATSKYLGRLN